MPRPLPSGPVPRKPRITAAAAAFPLANFFGVEPSDAILLPCSGVDSVFDVQVNSLPVGIELLAYWNAIATSNGKWMQTGYLISSLQPGVIEWFAQVWDLPTNSVIQTWTNQTALTTGQHDFRIYHAGAGTIWLVELDSILMATFDMGASSTGTGNPTGYPPVQVFMEEQQSGFNPSVAIKFNLVLKVFKNGVWIPAPNGVYSASLAQPPLSVPGIAGRLQDSTLGNNQMVIGGATPVIPDFTALWSGVSTLKPTTTTLTVVPV